MKKMEAQMFAKMAMQSAGTERVRENTRKNAMRLSGTQKND